MIKVKKILVVGKFHSIFDEDDFLSNLYTVQICVDRVQMVKGMIALKNPDLVMVSLVGISDDAEKIFEEFRYNYKDVPVICIGTDEDVKAHIDSISTVQFTILNTPVGKDEIVDTINSALNIGNNDDMPADDNGGKKSILLVDDSNVQLRALNELLKDKYEVRMATSGMQALTMIGRKRPDMIFLDYEMPVCDGRMTLEMIRELDESKDIPVVFLTRVSDMDHITAVLNLKPAGYLLKPADANKIYAIIEETIG